MTTADFVGAGQFAIVGIQLFVQHEEAADLATCQQGVLRQVGIHLFDALFDELVHIGLLARSV